MHYASKHSSCLFCLYKCREGMFQKTDQLKGKSHVHVQLLSLDCVHHFFKELENPCRVNTMIQFISTIVIVAELGYLHLFICMYNVMTPKFFKCEPGNFVVKSDSNKLVTLKLRIPLKC